MLDFGLLPPEINSDRMYTGPGSGPMLTAAAAWDSLAAHLYSTAASYSSVISRLTAGWQGPSSAMMAAAAAPYTAWISTTAGQAEQTANQARAAAAAYEAAFLATVPPPVIAANRSLLMSLIATNFFGQNFPAIIATEAQYAEMWAQDAVAMYGYAGSAAGASQVTPFNPPPQTTDPAGTGGQSAAVAQAAGTGAGTSAQTVSQAMSAVPQSLQSLATPVSSAAPVAAAADPPSPLSTIDSFITGPLSPLSLFTIPGVPYLLGTQSYLTPQAGANLTGANARRSRDEAKLVELGVDPQKAEWPQQWPNPVAGPGSGSAAAGLGRAGVVGKLSVPPGWTAAAPDLRLVTTVLPEPSLAAAPQAALAADGPGSLFGNMAMSGLAGRAVAGTGDVAVRSAGVGGGAVAARSAGDVNIFLIPEDD